MSDSSLVSYENLTKNKTTVNNKQNLYIIPHVYVGQVSTKNGVDHFKTAKGASCQYVIGTDGTIGQSVLEADRAWTTGGDKTVINKYGKFTGRDMDFKSVTIEMACDAKDPYAINDKVYNALIRLMADIAIRNNMGELKWKADPSLVGCPAEQNVLVHRWFARKACPGNYVFDRLADICNKANKIIKSGNNKIETRTIYKVQCGAFSVRDNAEKLKEKLRTDKYDAIVVKVNTLYKVQCGAFSVRNNAEKLKEKLRADKYDAIVVEVK